MLTSNLIRLISLLLTGNEMDSLSLTICSHMSSQSSSFTSILSILSSRSLHLDSISVLKPLAFFLILLISARKSYREIIIQLWPCHGSIFSISHWQNSPLIQRAEYFSNLPLSTEDTVLSIEDTEVSCNSLQVVCPCQQLTVGHKPGL